MITKGLDLKFLRPRARINNKSRPQGRPQTAPDGKGWGR